MLTNTSHCSLSEHQENSGACALPIKIELTSSQHFNSRKKLNYLLHLNTLCTEPYFPGGIIWCYSEQGAVPQQQMTALKKNVQFLEGLSENFGNVQGLPCLFILDDLLNEVFSRTVCDLCTESSHHRNLSDILITQKYFHQAPTAATYI
jgi:hypothetical protein